MSIRILDVVPGSPAEKAGLEPDDILLRINGEDILDEIDYQALTTHVRLTITFQKTSGNTETVTLRKGQYTPLGLKLDESVILRPRSCRNHCVFCFVDQMPAGMRDTLYVKDDDWRLSLMMGNFVTLTNVDDREFDRILRRKVSPLYISVHATDPEVRVKMLGNPHAGNIMDRLRTLRDHGLKFHCQVVLCPGLNDGSVLHRTIAELGELYPAAQSLAVVPVGLTRYRDGLPELRLYDSDSARQLLRELEPVRSYYLRQLGTRFVFPADEFYSLAGCPVPSDVEYEDYAQFENGVGMLRRLEEECEAYWEETNGMAHTVVPRCERLLIPTGFSAERTIRSLAEKYAPRNVSVSVIPVPNRFFGSSVTVTGLIVGRDLLESIRTHRGDRILIAANMLRENSNCFLDDLTTQDVEKETGLPVRVVDNTGRSFINALYDLEDTICQNL